jgi:DNA-directed RNA polymerase specialized sigma24 family protein
LILRFIEGKNHQEVADVVGKSLTAVRSIQHRALVELTRLLGSEDKVRHYLRGGGHV